MWPRAPGMCAVHMSSTHVLCACVSVMLMAISIRWIDYAVVPRTPPNTAQTPGRYAPSRVPVAVGERYPRAVPRRRPATGPAAVYRRLLAYTQGSWFKDKVRNYRTIEHTVETFGINT